MKSLRKRTILFSFFLSVVCFFTLAVPVSAATMHEINTRTMFSNDSIISFNKRNLEKVIWANGITHGSQLYDSGNTELYTIKIPKYQSPATISGDIVTLKFSNVCTIGDKNVNCDLTFSNFNVGAYNFGQDLKGENKNGYIGIFALYTNRDYISIGSESTSGRFPYAAHKSIDYNLRFYYDDGTTVELPFIQRVDDLDTGNSYSREAWSSVSGYNGEYYKYATKDTNGNLLNSFVDKLGVRHTPYPLQFTYNGENLTVQCPARNPNKVYNYLTSGVDSTYCSGIYAQTKTGEFKSRYFFSDATAELLVYNQYQTELFSTPTKSVNKTNMNVGEKATYTINHQMGTLYKTVLVPYKNLKIEDKLPEGLEYKGARVIDGKGKDITDSQGTLQFDAATNTVTYEFNKSWVENNANYNGQTIEMEIDVVAKALSEESLNAENVASVSFENNKITARTNKAVVKISHPWCTSFTVDKEPTCLEAGSKSIHCTVCNVTKDVTSLSALGHSFTNYVSNKDATCIKDGTKTAKCDRCDVTDTRVDKDSALGHAWNPEWTIDKKPTCTEKGSKSHHCTVCNVTKDVTEIPANGHDFSKWELVESPNCTDKGSSHRECKICDYEEFEDVDPYGHQWNSDYTIDKEPTCLDDGSKSIHCTVCDVKKDIEAIPSLGHDMGEWVTTKESTCLDKGEERRDCNRCDYFETKELNAKGHVWDSDYTVDKEPTCLDDGSKSIHCTVCDEKNDVTSLPALGHDLGEWHITKEPAIDVKGEKQRECQRNSCDYKEVMELPALAKPETAPKTGDNANVMTWVVILLLSFSAVGIVVIKEVKKINK